MDGDDDAILGLPEVWVRVTSSKKLSNITRTNDDVKRFGLTTLASPFLSISSAALIPPLGMDAAE